MSPNSPLEHLLNFGFAAGAAKETRQALARECRPLDLRPRERVPADRVSFVASGHAKFVTVLESGDEHIANFIWPGGWCAPAAEEQGALVALSRCLIFTFTPETFFGIINSDRDGIRSVLDALVEQVQDQRAHAATVSCLSAGEKIERFLNKLATERGVRDTAGIRLTLPMSRADIGNHLGLTIETVSRCMAQLQRSGAISFPSRREVVFLPQAEAAP
jgi:CRP-like cAMP-binding protein